MTESRQVTWRTNKKNLKEGITGTTRPAPEMGPDWFAFVEEGEDPTSANGFLNVRYVHASQITEVLVQCTGAAIAEQKALMEAADSSAVHVAPAKTEKKPTAKASAKG